MPKVNTDKLIALLIETYCRRMGIDRTITTTILDDVLEQMGFKVENGDIVELNCETPAMHDELLDRKLTNFALTVRTLNVLKANNIETVRDLVRLNRMRFIGLRSVGKTTINEIEDFLIEHNLQWEMNV